VEDEADSVINPLVITKGMVATFMGNDPDSGANAALKNPINRPCKVAVGGRKHMKVRSCDVVEKENAGEIINNIGERAAKGSLEAMGRDGLLDVAKREWWLRVRHPLEGVLLLFVFGCWSRHASSGPHFIGSPLPADTWKSSI